MMQDPLPIPSSFFYGGVPAHSSDPLVAGSPAAPKPGQSAVVSVYRTKIAGRCRLITVTWYKNLLIRCLSVSVISDELGADSCDDDGTIQVCCRVELRPWNLWRRRGSRRFDVGGRGGAVDVLWDLRAATGWFCTEPEPRSGYYVAVVCEEEVVFVVGDMKKEAYRKSGYPPSTVDAILVSKKEHVFGRRRFSTKAKFEEKGRQHDVCIECYGDADEQEMVLKIDGKPSLHVRHLQWKFRGNESISIDDDKVRVEVCWDVHDWLFGPGTRHALFVFKPFPSAPSTASSSSPAARSGGSTADFNLFLYAWKLQ